MKAIFTSIFLVTLIFTGCKVANEIASTDHFEVPAEKAQVVTQSSTMQMIAVELPKGFSTFSMMNYYEGSEERTKVFRQYNALLQEYQSKGYSPELASNIKSFFEKSDLGEYGWFLKQVLGTKILVGWSRMPTSDVKTDEIEPIKYHLESLLRNEVSDPTLLAISIQKLSPYLSKAETVAYVKQALVTASKFKNVDLNSASSPKMATQSETVPPTFQNYAEVAKQKALEQVSKTGYDPEVKAAAFKVMPEVFKEYLEKNKAQK